MKFLCAYKCLVVAALVFLVGACDSPAPPDISPQEIKPEKIVVAVIDNREITKEEFEDYLNRVHDLEKTTDDDQFKKLKSEFLFRYVENVLLLKEAERKNVTVTDKEVLASVENIKKEYPPDYFNTNQPDLVADLVLKEETRNDLIIKKLIRLEVFDKIKITQDELEKYYNDNKEEFNQEETVRVRQIVVDTEKKANGLRQKILAGSNFQKLAKKYSLSPDREEGGDLGYFTRGQMPLEFDEVAFSLKRKGQVSQVFRSDYGYHIFQLVAKRRAKKLKFSEVKDKILKILKQHREQKQFSIWFSELKKQASVKINNPYQ